MKIKNAVLLLLTAAIWGIAFVAQSVGMDYVGPLTFNCVRSLIGGVVLLPCIWYFDKKRNRERRVPVIPGARKTLVIGGVCCGVALDVYKRQEVSRVLAAEGRVECDHKLEGKENSRFACLNEMGAALKDKDSGSLQMAMEDYLKKRCV